MASIHVDDTRFAGDETANEIWDQLRQRLKFGKHRQATDRWQKFCGRWERQDPDSLEMEYSMEEYIKTIPFVITRETKNDSTSSATATTSPHDRPTAPTSATTATTYPHDRPSTDRPKPPPSATSATTSTQDRPSTPSTSDRDSGKARTQLSIEQQMRRQSSLHLGRATFGTFSRRRSIRMGRTRFPSPTPRRSW